MRKKEVVKGFKGFNKDLKCRNFQYEVGKTYEIKEDIKLCSTGFHFCRDFKNVDGYYDFRETDNRFCEIEALGKVIDQENSEKSVTNRIKIVREIPRQEMYDTLNEGKGNTGFYNTGYSNTGNSNTGNRNTGNSNTGNSNTGNRNTGNSNTGNRNTGYSNTGYSNTGDRNTGDRNTGDWNTGYSNTGNSNTGNRNTGNSNTGYSNTGNRNTGDWNTGDSNTGDSNTGDWNKTNRSAGVLCNQEPKMLMFNKPTDMTWDEWQETRAFDLLCDMQKSEWIWFDNMTDDEKAKYPSAKTCDGYLKEYSRAEASTNWWDDLDDYDKNEIFSLPNFNLKVFNDIMELEIAKKEYNELMKNVKNS